MSISHFKVVYILEFDEKCQQQIVAALWNIDPQLQIRIFEDLNSYFEWFKTAVSLGPSSLLAGGRIPEGQTPVTDPANTAELRLIIADDEILGTRQMRLIEKAQKYFVDHGFCPSTNPTSVVITAYDNPDFEIKLAEKRIVNNVIFKPFDLLILRQHLEFAVTGHFKVKVTTLAEMTSKAVIEMIKEVTVSAISEVGFSSINDAEITVGTLTQYYSDLWDTPQKAGSFAKCVRCNFVAENIYHCDFHFFGIEPTQIQQLRRKIILENPGEQILPPVAYASAQSVLVLSEHDHFNREIKNFLDEKIDQLTIFSYESAGQLFSDLQGKDSPHRQELPATIHKIFIHISFLKDEFDGRIKQLRELQPDATIYLFSDLKETPSEIRRWGPYIKGYYHYPFDRSLLIKQLRLQEKDLFLRKELQWQSVPRDFQILVGNPVTVNQFSEAGMTMTYYRPLDLGSFRNFRLSIKSNEESPLIPATVHFTQAKEKEFENHFVFFGMTDHYLKHIRNWIKAAYIQSKGN